MNDDKDTQPICLRTKDKLGYVRPACGKAYTWYTRLTHHADQVSCPECLKVQHALAKSV
jgi:hypothetical protein